MQNTLHSLSSAVISLLSPVFCLLCSFVKRHLNNQKGWLIKGKSTKIAAAFMQNKANFKNIKIGISSFETSKYEILPALRGEKTNPIQTQLPKGQK